VLAGLAAGASMRGPDWLCASELLNMVEPITNNRSRDVAWDFMVEGRNRERVPLRTSILNEHAHGRHPAGRMPVYQDAPGFGLIPDGRISESSAAARHHARIWSLANRPTWHALSSA
jgi:hypothetical protein